MGLREEVLKLARGSGFQTGKLNLADGNGDLPFARPVASGDCLVELERFYQSASLAAAEKVKEEAARVLEAKKDWYESAGFPREYSAARAGAKSIRAIDLKKLLEGGPA